MIAKARPTRDLGKVSRWLLAVLALLLLLGHGASFRFAIDDAYITYRYADNLLAGEGLVFNPGESVEGYSNLSWVLLNAAGIGLDLDPLLWSRIMGTVCLGGLLLLLPGIVRRLLPEAEALGAAVAQFLMAACGAVACWMLAGLETPLFALLMVAAWGAALRRDGTSAGLLGILLVLTRPEGPALGLIFTAWAWLPGPATPAGWRRWLGPAIFIAGTAAFFLWRHATFGFWLPNTYYAKTGDLAGQIKTGLPYGLDFLRSYLGPLAAAAVVARFAARAARWPNHRDFLLSLGLVVFWLGYTVLIGGDMLGMYRFFVPVLPVILTLTAVWLAAAGWLDTKKRAVLVTVVLGSILILPSFMGKERRLVSIHMSEANLGGWILAGDALAERLPRDAVIALGPAGYIPWITEVRAYDFYGLVDPEIAHQDVEFTHGYAGHEKHDGALVLARRPDYLLIGNVDITDRPRTTLIPPLDREVDIVTHPEFVKNYEQIYIPVDGGKYLNLFRRKGS